MENEDEIEVTREDIENHPNDADLGKHIRDKFIKIHGYGSNI